MSKHRDWFWIKTNIPMTKKEVTAEFGEPCPDYEKGCATCDAWKEHADTGRVTVVVERDRLLDTDAETEKETNMAAKNTKKMTIVAQKKAEELIEAKFSALRTTIVEAAAEKAAEAKALWENDKKLTALKAKLAKAQEVVRKVEAELEAYEVYDNTYGHSVFTNNSRWHQHPDKPSGLRNAYAAIRKAERGAIAALDSMRNDAIKKLWFESLDSTALEILDSVPTPDKLLGFDKLNAKKLLGRK